MDATAETSLRRDPVVVVGERDRADVLSVVSGVERHCPASLAGPFLRCVKLGHPKRPPSRARPAGLLFCFVSNTPSSSPNTNAASPRALSGGGLCVFVFSADNESVCVSVGCQADSAEVVFALLFTHLIGRRCYTLKRRAPTPPLTPHHRDAALFDKEGCVRVCVCCLLLFFATLSVARSS